MTNYKIKFREKAGEPINKPLVYLIELISDTKCVTLITTPQQKGIKTKNPNVWEGCEISVMDSECYQSLLTRIQNNKHFTARIKRLNKVAA